MRLGIAFACTGLAALALPSTAVAGFSTTSSSSFFYAPNHHGGTVAYGGALNNYWLHFPGAWSANHSSHFSHRDFDRGWSGWGEHRGNRGGDGPHGGDGPQPTPPRDGPGSTIGGPGDGPPVVTPEPVTMTLLATGLAGIGAAKTRRRKDPAQS